MSGSRLTRKVTVEGSKKMSDSNAPRKSVFDRLGPGTVERTQSRRDDYLEPQPEKCRNWLRDGRCLFGSKCRYDHSSSSEVKSKLKIIRSVVSKTDETGETKGELRVKRFQNPEDSPSEQSPKKTTKKHKSEKVKGTKEYVKGTKEYVKEGNDTKVSREQRKDKEDTKVVVKKKDVIVKRTLSASGWNLQDQSESDEAVDAKHLDWEERGQLNQEREVALEERRNDLRRQIAKMDEHVEPIVNIPNEVDVPVVRSQVTRSEQDSTPPTQLEDVKSEKKKKTKSDKSKKKSKKKSHKSDAPHMQSEPSRIEMESGEKTKRAKSPSSGKKKKRHDSRNDSDRELPPPEVSLKKEEYQKEIPRHEYTQAKRSGEESRSAGQRDQKSKHRHSHESRREKDPRQPHFEQFQKQFEETVPPLKLESDRKRQKVTKVSASERNDEGRKRDDRGKKKPPQWSPSREFKNVGYRDEQVTEVRRSGSRPIPTEQKEAKRKSKKNEKMKESTVSSSSSRPIEEEWNKGPKPMIRHEEKKKNGPRTPSPDIKQSSSVSRNPDAARNMQSETSVRLSRKLEVRAEASAVSSKSVNSDLRHSAPVVPIIKPPKSAVEEKQRHSAPVVPIIKPPKSAVEEKQAIEQEANENTSESSDNDSSSSEESVSCEVESVSGEEQKNEGIRTLYRSHDVEEKKTESFTPEQKQERHNERREDTAASREPEQVERPIDEPRERQINEPRDRPLGDPKERLSDRREERGEKYHRERVRDHRRPRDDEPERRVENRGPKDTREIKDSRDVRDHKDMRDYRELPKIDHREPRDRERHREFDEREKERHPPVDIRRNDGPSNSREYGERPGHGRGGWARDRHVRGRGGYGSYDGRGQDQDERRTEGRPPQDYDRNCDRDRGHPGRGSSRYREVNEHHGGAWHERRVDRNYREPERERERFPENRERLHEDTRGARPKRPPRSSPEGSRNDRRGYREEQDRRPFSPPEESEEWDYEEGHSPVTQMKEQLTASRKRPKEQSSPRSPRSEAPKRKKVSSPEPVPQDPQETKEKIPEPLDQQVTPQTENVKEHEKESKKAKKDKSKKTKKRKLSETETETTETVDTPEHKRPREPEQTNKEKQVKKPKLKNQPEVLVRPWSDLENDEDDSKGQEKKEKDNVETTVQSEVVARTDDIDGNKAVGAVFSDWSDASEDAVLNKEDTAEPSQVNDNVVSVEPEKEEEKEEKAADGDASFDDVYDPISDDEFEAMFAGDEDEAVIKKKTTPLPVDEVDWSILGSTVVKKESEPGDYIKRFSAGNIFSRIGLSSALAGPALTKLVQEKCAQDAPDMKMKDLLAKPTGNKFALGALVAAEARKIKERANVVNDIGPCRRALCARRDFNIRKQLRKLTSTKLGAKLVLSHSAVEPVDNELFAVSVALFRRQKQGLKQEPQVQSRVLPESAEVAVC